MKDSDSNLISYEGVRSFGPSRVPFELNGMKIDEVRSNE